MAEWLEVSSKAPEFVLQDKEGKEYSLSDFLGKKVVLYFYPRDNTPGCTKQACSFRDLRPEFDALNTVVIGVSADDAKSHQKFTDKYELNFLLLSDPGHEVLKKYGAWREKNLYGKISLGIVRSTYLIDEEGKIQKVYKRAKAATNAEDILSILKNQ